MSEDLMILAKDVEWHRMVGKRCYLSEKIDGVPAIFGAFMDPLSRQGEALVSAPHIANPLRTYLYTHEPSLEIIGELHVPGAPFKVSSGKARSKSPQAALHLAIWDVVWNAAPRLSYAERFEAAQAALHEINRSIPQVAVVPMSLVEPDSPEQAEALVKDYYEYLAATLPYHPEGVMIRIEDEPYKYGRSWGMMRYVVHPTIDLRVVGVEEATAKKRMKFLGQWYEKGEGLGAVGRIVVSYKGNEIGVGPGAMSHADRRFFWSNQSDLVGQIIKIKYKRDDTYEALRQPTFVAIHPDKTTPDA